jgi:cytochrome b561
LAKVRNLFVLSTETQWFLGIDNGEIQGVFANVLPVIAPGHALMARYHRYVLKDGLLRRMMRAK